MTRTLKSLRNERGWTQEEAAERFGLSKGGYVKIEVGQRPLSLKHAKKASEVFNVPLTSLLEDGVQEVHESQQKAPVVGIVQAGAWLEADSLLDEPMTYLPVLKDHRFPHIQRVVYRVQGDSYDFEAPDGSHVVCVPWAETGLELQRGMTVVAQRSRDGGLVQRTLKCVEGRPGAWRLVPKSTNPKHQPILFENGDDVEVIALVIEVYKQMTWGDPT